MPEVRLRRAGPQDSALLLAWRNDPGVIETTTSQRPVGEAEHQRWFAGALSDPAVRQLIVLVDGDPVGQVRFNRRDARDAVISVALASAHRGRGIGPVAIRRATDFVRQEWDGVRVLAYVREPNEASRGVFLKAGFVVTAPDPQCPPGHVSFVST